jgi:hypothetical protein
MKNYIASIVLLGVALFAFFWFHFTMAWAVLFIGNVASFILVERGAEKDQVDTQFFWYSVIAGLIPVIVLLIVGGSR